MRPSRSANFGQMSVVVMGSPGVGENIYKNVSKTYFHYLQINCRKNESPSHRFNQQFSQ